MILALSILLVLLYILAGTGILLVATEGFQNYDGWRDLLAAAIWPAMVVTMIYILVSDEYDRRKLTHGRY